MKKIKINMLSKADSVEGQGVGSAYKEQVGLLKEGAEDIFDVVINDKGKSDIIHVHSINLPYYFRLKKATVPTVTYVHFLPHTLDGSINLPKPIFNIFKKYVVSFYKKSSNLVVVNPIFIKDLEQYGIDPSKVTYIPNYVTKEKFFKKGTAEKRTIREKYGYSEEDFIVIGAGQIQTRKGVLDFCEVAKALPDVKFVWCGGFSFGKITDGYTELKKMMDNPPKNVNFIGMIKREEMNNMYNMSDLLFMPSYNELFPMAILESSNTNTPLLVRDLELYEDILFKKYLKGENNTEFTKIIQELTKKGKTYKDAVENALYISEYYSKENVLELWKKYYTSLVDNKE